MLPDSGIGPDKIEKKSATGNSKQARSLSASCFCLRKWPSMGHSEVVLAVDTCCGCSEHWCREQRGFRVRAYQQEEPAFPSGLQGISKFAGQRLTRLKHGYESKELFTTFCMSSMFPFSLNVMSFSTLSGWLEMEHHSAAGSL